MTRASEVSSVTALVRRPEEPRSQPGGTGELQGDLRPFLWRRENAAGQVEHLPGVLDAAEIGADGLAERARGPGRLVSAQEAELARAQALGGVVGGHLPDRAGQLLRRATGAAAWVGVKVKGQVRRIEVEQVLDAIDTVKLAAQHRELPADVDGGSRGLAGEVPRRDEDRLVVDPAWVAAEQVAQRVHVDGGLDRGRGYLRGIGLAVDDGERLDLDNVEPAAMVQRDQVGLQVGVAAADREAEQRVVEHRAGRRVGGCQQLPRPAMPDQGGLVAADDVQVVVVRLLHVETEVLAKQGEQLRGAALLDLRLERVPPDDGEPRLAERRGMPDVRRDQLLVHAGGVHQGAPRAARVSRERRDRAGGVADRKRTAAQLVKARLRPQLWRRARVHSAAALPAVTLEISRVSLAIARKDMVPKSCSAPASSRARAAASPRARSSVSLCTVSSAAAASLTAAGCALPPDELAPGMLAENRCSRRRAACGGSGIRSIASATRTAAVRKSTRGDSEPMTRRSSGHVETASSPREGAR